MQIASQAQLIHIESYRATTYRIHMLITERDFEVRGALVTSGPFFEPHMTEASIQQADSDDEPTEPKFGLECNWPLFLVAQRSPSADHPDALFRPQLLATNQGGLDLLERYGDVRSLWIVRVAEEGLLTTETVKHLCLWRLVPDKNQHPVTALLCESGAIYIVDGDHVFEVDEVTQKWFAQGAFKSAQPQKGSGSPTIAEPAEHG
jgi:hypothetical protein